MSRSAPAAQPATDLRRTLVVIPTYNELENLPIAVTAVLEALPDGHVLVVDDSSPDGTGALADVIAARVQRVHVLHRSEKDGLGGAYLAGFAWALDHGYDIVGEFDADGSHPAAALPRCAMSSDTKRASRW